MKKIIASLAFSMLMVIAAKADDRPVTFAQLPVAAQAFITEYYAADAISYATVDDDIILPDYTVVLVSGVRIQFENNGSLEKVEFKRQAVPDGLLPIQITDYVKAHYKDVTVQEYEVGRRSYEVRLSNGLELRFNRNFALVGIDD